MKSVNIFSLGKQPTDGRGRVIRFRKVFSPAAADFDIHTLPVTIGRTDADVVLKDQGISRKHCEIHYDGCDLVIRDLNSRNGVQVNDQNVQQATLSPNDVIGLGTSLFRVEFARADVPFLVQQDG